MSPQEVNQPTERAYTSPHEELEALRVRVSELEAERPDIDERDIVREAVREHVASAPERSPLGTPPIPPPGYHEEPPAPGVLPAQDGALDIVVDSEHKEEIIALLREVERHGVVATVRRAEKLTPHLMDDFHAALRKYMEASAEQKRQ